MKLIQIEFYFETDGRHVRPRRRIRLTLEPREDEHQALRDFGLAGADFKEDLRIVGKRVKRRVRTTRKGLKP